MVIAILSLFFSIGVSAEDSLKMPQGWKVANPKKNTGCEQLSGDLFVAKGDFDGDGKTDTAKLLAKSDGTGIGVWVWLSTQKDAIFAGGSDQKDGHHSMGIETVKPGTYDTACGKGHWPCKGDEKPKIVLTDPAINFFTCESAARYLYWSPTDKKIKETWISD